MLDKLVKNKDKLAPVAVILTALLSGVVVDEVKDTLGTTVLYHPVTVWCVLFCLIFVQSRSFTISVMCVVGYEVLKLIWQKLNLEPSKLATTREIIHNVTAGGDLSDHDIDFLNKATPPEVVIEKKAPKGQ